MSEPHQRTRSGKLRNASRKKVTSFEYREKPQQYPGINNAKLLVQDQYDTVSDRLYQTPCMLTDIHVSVLGRISAGLGISDNSAIDKAYRNTWNIGKWIVKGKFSISFNIVQPNINQGWIDISSSLVDKGILGDTIEKINSLNLPNSSCALNGVNTIKLQGRWSYHVLQELLDKTTLRIEDTSFSGVGIGGSRIFAWMKLSNDSEYMCTLTSESVNILMFFAPDWSNPITEVSSGNSISIRLKDPLVPNDALALTIDCSGYIRYNGKPHNIQRLTQVLSICIKQVMKSSQMKKFIQSLEFAKL